MPRQSFLNLKSMYQKDAESIIEINIFVKVDSGELYIPIKTKRVKNRSTDETLAITILNSFQPLHKISTPETKSIVPVNHLFLLKNLRTYEEENTGHPALCCMTTLGLHVPIPSTS